MKNENSENRLRATNATEDKLSMRPILLGISITTISSIPVFLTGALAVQIRHDLHLNASHLGAAVAVFFASASLTSIASGRLAERSGVEIIMRVCVILSVITLGGIAFLATSYPVFLIFLALGGITNGAVQPAVNLFLSNVVPLSRLGMAFGVKQAAIPMATFLSGLAVPSLALTIGWHYAYLFVAPVGLILFFLIPKRAPVGLRVKRRDQIREKVYLPPLIVLAIGMGLGSSAANGLGAFLVSSAVHSGWAPGAAGLLVVLGSVTGFSARLLNGFMADRRNGKHIMVTAWMVGTGGIGYLLLMLGYSWLIIPATMVSYGAGWGWNGLFNFAVVWNYPRSAGYATGITQSGAYVGSVFGPLFFGLLVDRSGYPIAWTSAGIEAFGAAIAMVIARRMILASPARFSGGQTT